MQTIQWSKQLKKLHVAGTKRGEINARVQHATREIRARVLLAKHRAKQCKTKRNLLSAHSIENY